MEDLKINEKSEDYYKDHLLNLLAVIHRDGGHYTYRHGVEKSVKNATEKITKQHNQ